MIGFILKHITTACLIIDITGLLIIMTNVHDIKMISVGKKFIYLAFIMFALEIICPTIGVKDVQSATVQVEVVGQSKTSPTSIFTGKSVIPVAGTYDTTVEYNGQTYHLEGKDIYDKYIDKVGRHVAGTLKTTVYVDGSENKEIIEIQ